MATSMRPALATAASTARSTEASSVTSSSRTYIGSEFFSASVRIPEAFLALRPPGSRIVAKTVCPLRARVSANSLPKPVLEPVMRTTCLEFMINPPYGATRETRLMPEAKRLDTRIAIIAEFNESSSEAIDGSLWRGRSAEYQPCNLAVPGGANQFPGGLLPLWTTAFSRRTRLIRYRGVEAASRVPTHFFALESV